MNREILFKAKRKDNNEWASGNLIYNNVSDKYWIDLSIEESEVTDGGLFIVALEVIPETICQGTILENGLKIFEGDIYHYGDTNITYTVVWHDSGLIGKQNQSSSYAGLEAWADRIQIIGNIFDTSEIMLTLPIKKKWFDMILSGEKKEEYREIKPYYDSRFLKCHPRADYYEPMGTILLRNGYGKNKPTLKCKVEIAYDTGKPEWGAEPNKLYYVLKILSVEEVDDNER